MKEIERVSKWDSTAVVSDTPLVIVAHPCDLEWKLLGSLINPGYSLVPRPHPHKEEKGVWLQYDIPLDPVT